MLRVEASLVNGGAMDWEVDESVYLRLLELRRDGLDGMALVEELLTDDWGAPPYKVRIVGRLDDGTEVDESIHCDTRPPRRRR